MMVATASQAQNEITVVITGSGSGRPATIQFDANEAINAANGLPTIETTDTRVNIYSTGTLAAAGRVTFAAAGSTRTTDLEVFIGTGAFPTTQSDLTEVVTDWAGIAALPTNLVGKVRLAGAISGDLTNPGGSDKSFSVKEVFRLEVGDEIQGPFEATGTGYAISRINFGRSNSAGTITASNGDIATLNATSTSGVIGGTISALNGKIGNIIAAGGISISNSDGILARDGIDSIIAGYDNSGTMVWKDIDANITANSGGASIYTFIGNLECNDLSGSVTGFDLGDRFDLPAPPGIVVHGDLYAPLNFDTDVFGAILVAGSFLSDAELNVHGYLHASVIAGGSITDIAVDYDIVWPANGSDLIVIKSETGSIGSVKVGGDVLRDDLNAGYEVSILAAAIGLIECVNFSGFIGHPDGPESDAAIGDLHTSGYFYGDLWCSTFGTFQVDGIFAPYADALYFAEIPAGKTLICGDILGTRNEPSIVVTSQQSLFGQIVIVGDWEGQVVVWDDGGDPANTIGGYSAGPFYTDTSADLGGGSVGKVEFNRHPIDSVPNQDEYVESVPTKTWPTSPYTRQTIALIHYGGVIDSLPNDIHKPVHVYARSIFSEEFEDITADCTVLVNPDGDGRAVWICLTPIGGVAQDFTEFYEYKVEPRVSDDVTDLRSDGTGLATAPNVYPFSHSFVVWPMAVPRP